MLLSRASFRSIICPLLAMSEIWPHIPPNAPEWPQGFFSNYKKIFGQNWVFWKLIEKKIIMSWFFKNKTNVFLKIILPRDKIILSVFLTSNICLSVILSLSVELLLAVIGSKGLFLLDMVIKSSFQYFWLSRVCISVVFCLSVKLCPAMISSKRLFLSKYADKITLLVIFYP